MLSSTSPRKMLKSPGVDVTLNINPKTSVTCSNVPEALFDASTAKKHFSKFGRVQKIRLLRKRQVCIIEYDQPLSAEQAVLNAGAFDGFMFDVTRYKPRMRRKSKREEDPDWIPDSDVEEELSAMRGAPAYRITRQKPMDVESPLNTKMTKVVKQSPVKKRVPVQKKTPVPTKRPIMSQPTSSGVDSPVPIVKQTTLSTFEAAAELHQLRSKVALTPDEQWRLLDARDRILRGWGGAGSRVQVGGATIGTCQDMCPEKELLHRQAEHQVMTLETVLDSDGLLEPWRAVKQYSRSSADQEIPMCYELRPAKVLMRTCSYMLHEIAEPKRQVTLADWFHFMWDRFRSIRKDITQQALCCAESIRLVELCARFHAHCAARLADLEHTQFDQKLNTENLAKCLQTLKHMYADVTPDMRPREAEFRGYIALLNLGDANFWWEIKQLPLEIQKSPPIVFAIQVFNAIDNNNYVRFFRLVQQKATYLQACILLRYFNDVRARALARIVKAYALMGDSLFPAADLMSALAFESVEKMKAFINHYGLRFGRIKEHELSIILSRHQFIESSDPFPIARAINLIESKRQCSVGEVIAGGPLPSPDYSRHVLYSSFQSDGKLKETSLVAEEQGYNTLNDSNKDVTALKAEIQRLAQGGRNYAIQNTDNTEAKFVNSKPKAPLFTATSNIVVDKKLFSFKPAITLEPTDVTKISPEKIDENVKNIFSFSKPEETAGASLFSKDVASTFTAPTTVFENKVTPASKILFKNKVAPDPKHTFDNKGSKNVFQSPEIKSLLNSKESPSTKSVYGNNSTGPKNPFENKAAVGSKVLFHNNTQYSKGLFENKAASGTKNVFENSSGSDTRGLFGQINNEMKDPFQNAQDVFKNATVDKSVFNRPDITKSIFGENVDTKQSDLNRNIFGNVPVTNSNHVENKNIFSSPTENSVFENPGSSVKFESGSNIFANPVQENQDAKEPHHIFATFSKTHESKNIFAKPDVDAQKNTPSIFAPNGNMSDGNVSPGAFFKNVLNQPNNSDSTKNYSIYQSKNKAQTVADNIMNSVTANAHTIYNFDQNEEEQKRQLELQRLNEEKLREEQIRVQQQRQEVERKQQELRRQEELRLQEQVRRQEEMKRQEEARRIQEEKRLLEQQRKREELRKQEELRRRLEEERKAELKRLAEEQERKFREAVERESKELVEDLSNEISNETIKEIIKDELEKLKVLMELANDTSVQIVTELCNEICYSEMKAEMFWTFKLMRKWFHVWRQQFFRNFKRRTLLEDTPVWLPERTPFEEAFYLRRSVEGSALKKMNDVHKGHKFSGELKQLPIPQAYNLMELIRSPLLKRMKEISYPYDKCFFWKVTLVAPGDKWLCRKIHVKKWLIDAFRDKKKHEESETLLYVGKESWNHLMNFAISVSLVNKEKFSDCVEAVEGTNGVLFYFTEKDNDFKETIQNTLKLKYPYQVVPVAIIMPKSDDTTNTAEIQNLLASCVEKKIISGFKIFLLESQNINNLLNESTKRALKWLAKKYPQTPPLEMDSLKSICQRYLGNEIWCRLRTERDVRMHDVLKDIYKLIECYNAAVDRLTAVITNEDLFNYAPFPLELKSYLDHTSPYPKPYEFITSNVRTSENITTITDIMRQLKLPNPSTGFNPINVIGMQQQIRTYCQQIGWFENPEEVVCKVVAVMPNELTDLNMSCEDFTQYFAHYDLIDFLNIIVYEKINKLNRFDNRFAIYEPSVLHEYRNIDWLYEVDALTTIKHKALECEDELDYFIEAKRRKIALDSLEYLMLEDKDSTLVEENMKKTDANITKYNDCSEAVKQLERELEEEKKKSVEFENMLRAALADV